MIFAAQCWEMREPSMDGRKNMLMDEKVRMENGRERGGYR